MSSPETGWDGVERRITSSIFKYRWRILSTWCVVFSLIVAWAVHENRINARKGKEAADAICTLKTDFRNRIRRSELFLIQYPEGIRGIPVEIIRDNIRSQRQTIKALKIKCPEPSASSKGSK